MGPDQASHLLDKATEALEGTVLELRSPPSPHRRPSLSQRGEGEEGQVKGCGLLHYVDLSGGHVKDNGELLL